MTAEEHRGLGLLLVLSSSGCLGLPRYVDDEVGDDDDDGTTTQAPDDGPQGPEGPGTTSANDEAAASFVFMPDVGPITSPTTAGESDVTTDPPLPVDACQAYSAFITECYGSGTGESAFGYCVEYMTYLGQYTPECVPAFEDYLVCISTLACRDLSSGEPFCEIEAQKLDECQQG